VDGGVPAGAASVEEQSSSKVEPEETSAVDVSGQHLVVQAAGVRAMQVVRASGVCRQAWDLVKRCDQPGKVLIQLESLILAQSERWRQA
jgi:hypothetical protein